MKVTVTVTVSGDRDNRANRYHEDLIFKYNIDPVLKALTKKVNALSESSYGLIVNMAYTKEEDASE